MRSDFSSSSLVRMLGEWAEVPADPSGMDVGERLGLWVNAFDAIGLQSAHTTLRALPAAPRKAGGAAALHASLQDDVQRVRQALAHAIAQTTPALEDPDAGPGRYHQRHLDLQRMMEQMVRPLRDHVRQRVSPVSHRLRQLAALDAVMEPLLLGREQTLLPQAALVLKRRFERLQAAGPQPPGWLQDFERDWRQALHAEVDLRLQPVLGLVAALSHELNHPE